MEPEKTETSWHLRRMQVHGGPRKGLWERLADRLREEEAQGGCRGGSDQTDLACSLQGLWAGTQRRGRVGVTPPAPGEGGAKFPDIRG